MSLKGRIFLSYRRDDSRYATRSIYERLSAHFGDGAVFMDVDTIPAGSDFVEVLQREVRACDVLVSIVGKDWLNIKDVAGNRRLDDPEDFVRIEVVTALERDICVVPVLLDGVFMPNANELPNELKPFARRNALRVEHDSFGSDIHRLIGQLELALQDAEVERANKGQTLQGESARIRGLRLQQKNTASKVSSGTLKRIPVLSWWKSVLGVVVLFLALFFISQPNIRSFDVVAGKDMIELGDSTKLVWDVSPFATRLSLSNAEEPINRGQVSLTVAPEQSTVFELTSGNWISGMFGLDQTQVVTVLVDAPAPQVNVFEVDRTQISKGQTVNLHWSVTDADEVFLTVGDAVYPLSESEYNGEREVLLEKNALVILEAKNASGSEVQSYFINVTPPYFNINTFTVWVRPDSVLLHPSLSGTVGASTAGKLFSPTNTPDPNFPFKFVELVPDLYSESGYRVQFNPDVREELQKGEKVFVEWDVDGVDSLLISPFETALPARGSQPFFVQESMNFVMTATSGELEGIYTLPVKVYDGEMTEAPTIEFFSASPANMVGSGEVELSWSVSGEWTRVNLSDAGGIIVDYLNPVGFYDINIGESTTLILTAYNGYLSTAKNVQIIVD